jgi:hypothetical protein
LPEISPLPPAVSANDLPGGQTEILNGCQIRSIDNSPVEGDSDHVPQMISDMNHWLNWNGDFTNPSDGEHNCVEDDDFDIEYVNDIQDPETPEQRDVSAILKCSRIDLANTEVRLTG